MDPQRPNRSYTRLITIALVIAALVIGGTAYVTLSTQGKTTTITASGTVSSSSISTSSFSGTASIQILTNFVGTFNTAQGLELRVALSTNSTGALVIHASDTNTENKVNNVTANDDWAVFPDKTGSDACGGDDSTPVQYAILAGDYGQNNYTTGAALTLWDTAAIVECPVFPQPSYFLFSPLSDNASSLASTNYSGTGYWTGEGPTAVFHPFPPGIYTVLGEDEWGDLVFLNFAVVIPPASSGSSYTVTAHTTQTMTDAINSANDLQLRLSLNTSSSSAGEVSVGISVDDYNTLPKANNVTVGKDWRVALGGSAGAPCWNSGYTVGFGIAQGYYTVSNITSAHFLDMVNPTATYACSLYLGYGNAAGFVFQPMSDVAASYGCNQQQCMTGSVSTGLTSSSWGPATGFWYQGGAFTSFPRGVYTVFAEDEWGNSVLAYFTIS